jgi:hypothetical protein
VAEYIVDLISSRSDQIFIFDFNQSTDGAGNLQSAIHFKQSKLK